MHLLLILAGILVLAAYLGGRGLVVLTLAGFMLVFGYGLYNYGGNPPPDDDIVDPVCLKRFAIEYPRISPGLDIVDCTRPRKPAERWNVNRDCAAKWGDKNCHYLVTSAVSVPAGRPAGLSQTLGAGD